MLMQQLLTRSLITSTLVRSSPTQRGGHRSSFLQHWGVQATAKGEGQWGKKNYFFIFIMNQESES
jgi:hypothetical protein